MVVKLYISSASIYTAAKKNQQEVQWLLSGLKIEHEVVDVGDAILEDERDFILQNGVKNKQGHTLLPQIFNGIELCGDYDGLQLAIENEGLFEFLKTEVPEKCPLKPVAPSEPEAPPAAEPVVEAAAEEAVAEEAATEEAAAEEAPAEAPAEA